MGAYNNYKNLYYYNSLSSTPVLDDPPKLYEKLDKSIVKTIAERGDHTFDGKRKWKIQLPGEKPEDEPTTNYYTEEEIRGKILEEEEYAEYADLDVAFDEYIKKYGAVSTVVYETEHGDVELDEFVDIHQKMQFDGAVDYVFNQWVEGLEKKPISRQEAKLAKQRGLNLGDGRFITTEQGKRKWHKNFRKRGTYTEQEIADVTLHAWYKIKEAKNSPISTNAIFNKLTKQPAIQQSISEFRTVLYKNMQEIDVNLPLDKYKKEQDVIYDKFKNDINDVLNGAMLNDPGLARDLQILQSSIQQKFQPLMKGASQLAAQTERDILGVGLHNSRLIKGLYEFTKMYNMGDNGITLMGTGNELNFKKLELDKILNAKKEGKKTIRALYSVTQPFTDKLINRTGFDIESSLVPIDDAIKFRKDEILQLEKKIIDTLVSNEDIRKDLQAIGTSDVFNEDGEISFDWDDVKEMTGKQGGQMLGLFLTLGYSSFAQHVSETYTTSLKEFAIREYTGRELVTKKDRINYYNNTTLEKRNNDILRILREGGGKEKEALIAGTLATGLDFVGTYFVGGQSLKLFQPNVIRKLLHDTWQRNAKKIVEAGGDLGRVTGVELGTEWTQDLLLKMGEQASLTDGEWWPQIDWANDKQWIGTGLEVVLTTPLIILGGKMTTTTLSHTYKQAMALTDPKDQQHFLDAQRRTLDEDLENDKISNEDYINALDELTVFESIYTKNKMFNHIEFAKFLKEKTDILDMREHILKIVKNNKQIINVENEIKQIQKEYPRLNIPNVAPEIGSDSFYDFTRDLPPKLQTRITKLWNNMRILDEDSSTANLKLGRILMAARYMADTEGKSKEIEGSYIFENKDEFKVFIRKEAINKLVNEQGMSEKKATKVIDNNLKNGFVYSNPKTKSEEANVNAAYIGIMERNNPEATVPYGKNRRIYNIKQSALDNIHGNNPFRPGEPDPFAFNAINHGILHHALKDVSAGSLQGLKKKVENELAKQAPNSPDIKRLLVLHDASLRKRYPDINKRSKIGLEEWFTNLGDVAAFMKIQQRDLQTVSGLESIANKVKEWFGVQPSTRKYNIDLLNGENILDFFQASGRVNNLIPKITFPKTKHITDEELNELAESPTAFSEAYETEHESRINELYTPELENLMEINQAFSELIQKEAHRPRGEGVPWSQLPGFNMDLFIEETLHGTNEKTGKLRGIAQFIWGDKAFDPNVNDNFFSYVRRNLTNRAMDVLKSGKVTSVAYQAPDYVEPSELDKGFEFTKSKSSLLRTLITTEQADIMKAEVLEKVGLVPDITNYYNQMRKQFGAYLTPIVENLQYTQKEYDSYVASEKFNNKINSINEKRKKPLTSKQINSLARIDLRKKWLRETFDVVFPSIPQRVLNKNFQDLKVPKLDTDGKHIRLGNDYQFERKDITKDDWVNYYFGTYGGTITTLEDESGYTKTNTTSDTRWAKLMSTIEVELRFDAEGSMLNHPALIDKIQTTRDLEKYEKLKSTYIIGSIAKAIERDSDTMFSESFPGFDAIIPDNITGTEFAKQAIKLNAYLDKTTGVESAKFEAEMEKYHPFVVQSIIYSNTEHSEYDGSINRNFGKLIERNKNIDAKPTKSLRGDKTAKDNLVKTGKLVIGKLLDKYGLGLIDSWHGNSQEAKLNNLLELIGYKHRALDPKSEKIEKDGTITPAGEYNKAREDLKKEILEKYNYKDGVDLSAIRLMNTRYDLYKEVGVILKLKSKTEKIKQLKALAPAIRKANKANINLAIDVSTAAIDLLQDGKIDKVQFLDLLAIQSNIVGGIKGLSALDFIEIKEGSQAPDENNAEWKSLYSKYKKEKTTTANKMTEDEFVVVRKNKNVKVSKEEWIEIKTRSKVLTDIKPYGEHMGANSMTMHGIADLAWQALEDPTIDIQTELEKIFLVHTQLLTHGSTSKLLDFDSEGTNLRVNPDHIFRLVKLLPKSVLNNIYGIGGESVNEVIIDFQKRYIELDQKSKTNKKLNEEIARSNAYSSVLTGDETIKRQLEIYKQIDTSLANARNPKAKRKPISLYDFDETLINTDSRINFTIPSRNPDGSFNIYTLGGMATLPKSGSLTAAEFADKYGELVKAGAVFDFSEFNEVINGEKGPFFDMAKTRYEKKGGKDIYVLTARSHAAKPAIYAFLKGMGLNIELDNIITLENGNPQAKTQFILEKAAEGYNDFGIYDDNKGVLSAARDLIYFLDMDSEIIQANTAFSEAMSDEFNNILFQTKGVQPFKTFSRAQAEARGMMGDRFSFIPASADDFLGLLYNFMGKGKQGEEHRAWFEQALMKPFGRAIRDFNAAKESLGNNYTGLKNKHKGVAKILNKETGYTGFTYETAMRVYLWNKQGMKIPGISQTDLRALNQIINSDSDLKAFADDLGKITKLEGGYIKPDEYWITGTIGSDMRNAANEYRTQYLQQWIQNKNIIFSPENLNKIQASYGNNFRSALDDILYRMENGRKRPSGNSKFTNNFQEWVNNSVGAIMFLNTRSAVLQTLSAVNFVNWSDNNPIKAGVAFANQPQFWKDFVHIFQSDMLKQRRSNLAFEVNANEIATAVTGKTDKARAALNYILKKGFLPTKMADSFAIAFGGATMYRNRLNTYLNQGLSQKEAESKAWIDFQEISESTQQSSREDLISQEQASPLGRLILAFQNTPMQYNRLMKKSYLDLVNGRGDVKTHISKIIYYGTIQNFVFSAMQQSLFAMIFDPDDDGDENDKYYNKKLNTINSMSDTIMRGLGIRGAAISTLKNMIMEFGKQSQKGWNADYAQVMIDGLNLSPPIGSKARKIYNATLTYKYQQQEIESMGFDIDNPAYLAIGNVVSATVNIPLDRVVKKINNVKAALDARNEDWQRVAVLLGWNTWNVNIPNYAVDEAKADRKSKTKKGRKKTEWEQLLEDLEKLEQ